jgi:hypothetical protein
VCDSCVSFAGGRGSTKVLASAAAVVKVIQARWIPAPRFHEDKFRGNDRNVGGVESFVGKDETRRQRMEQRERTEGHALSWPFT